MKLSDEVRFDESSHVCEMDLRYGEAGGGLRERLALEIRRLQSIRQGLIDQLHENKGG